MKNSLLSLMIRNKDELLPRIYEFNAQPAKYIHLSRLTRFTDMNGQAFKTLIQSRRAEKIMSTIILDKTGLKDDFHWDFEQERLRLALVGGQDLLTLVNLAGIAVNAGQISRVVEREPQLLLKKSIGSLSYLFALKKAPFLIGEKKSSFVKAQENYSDFKAYTLACGLKCMAACLSDVPRALTLRLGLKLPREIKGIFEDQYPADESRAAFLVLKKILLQEVDSQWATFIS